MDFVMGSLPRHAMGLLVLGFLLLGSRAADAWPNPTPAVEFEYSVQTKIDEVLKYQTSYSLLMLAYILETGHDEEIQSFSNYTWDELLKVIRRHHDWIKDSRPNRPWEGLKSTGLNRIVRKTWPHMPETVKTTLAQILSGFASNFSLPTLQLFGLQALNQIEEPGSNHGFWNAYEKLVTSTAPKMTERLAIQARSFIMRNSLVLARATTKRYSAERFEELFVSQPSRHDESAGLDAWVADAFRFLREVIAKPTSTAQHPPATQHLQGFISHCDKQKRAL